jgi:alkylation response protein AidB-like acyl-CoA dehydrogenase
MGPAHKAALIPKSSARHSNSATRKTGSGQRIFESLLTEEMLARFDSRAPTYDSENRFFHQDFEELRAARYFTIPVPPEFGGPGLSLAEVCREQRRLAYFAPATALAVNMHLYWVGVAADLWRHGDASLEWMLRDAAAGEIFAAGHAESGNDIPVLLSCSKAERAEGGYRFTGRKQFGSLTPVWTRFGLHGMDTSDPGQPKIVHAFMPRDSSGYIIKETWDVVGMRATRSDDTVLENAFIPDRYVARIVPVGGAGIDAFVLSMFAWALMGFGNIYYGLAKRALDKSIAAAKAKRSLAVSRRWHTTRRFSMQSHRWSSSWSPSVRMSSGLRMTGLVASTTARNGRRKSSPRNIER